MKSDFWKFVEDTAKQLEKNKPKPNKAKHEQLMAEMVKKYGTPSHINYFQGDYKFGPSWRIWYSNFHIHPLHSPRITSSDLCGNGRTLIQSINNVLTIEESYYVFEGGATCIKLQLACY